MPPVNLNETAKERGCGGETSAFEMVLPRIENIFKFQFVEMLFSTTKQPFPYILAKKQFSVNANTKKITLIHTKPPPTWSGAVIYLVFMGN